MARADDAGFRRVAPAVPTLRVGATGKRGRKRYGTRGTPHVRPSSPKAERRRAARTRTNALIAGTWLHWVAEAGTRKAA